MDAADAATGDESIARFKADWKAAGAQARQGRPKTVFSCSPPKVPALASRQSAKTWSADGRSPKKASQTMASARCARAKDSAANQLRAANPRPGTSSSCAARSPRRPSSAPNSDIQLISATQDSSLAAVAAEAGASSLSIDEVLSDVLRRKIRIDSFKEEYGRRGTRALEDLADEERIYDPQKEKAWKKKYQFYSRPTLKDCYRIYGRARRDPFNKDPSWGKMILANIAAAFDTMSIDLHQIFAEARVSDDTQLNRLQIKNALCNIVPSLSDLEVQTLFDTIDEDGSGTVSVLELCNALEEGRNAAVTEEAAERWRNPIHRFVRIPPATVEGWDHLVDEPEPTRELDEVCQEHLEQTLNHVNLVIDNKHCSPGHLLRILPKHQHFGGGGHTHRFERNRHMHEHASGGTRGTEPSIPDPGDSEMRPGFLCDAQNWKDMAALGFSAFSPRMQKPRRFQKTVDSDWRTCGVF
eukprot:TRINITY_DN7223_c0_g1_i2.p1 TRINITY_DN7223_c0_g1~~TRINITY_DN7223_c0_g1_i2.p1  ORF type:complete len:477 (+),score=78.17 TRINITY_DN7223_c0_g1_i2:27-1433(+)